MSNFATIGGSTSRGSARRTVATRSRTSCAAASMSRSRSKVAMTIELPGAGDRAQLVDALDGVDRLLDPLARPAISTSSGEAPGSVRADADGRQVDRREAVDAEPEVAGRADHDQARMSIAAKTGRWMQISASFCMARFRCAHPAGAAATGARPPATRTGVPSTRLPGSAITGSPAARPLDDLDALGVAAADGDALLDDLAVLDAQHLLDAGKGDQRGGRHDDRAVGCRPRRSTRWRTSPAAAAPSGWAPRPRSSACGWPRRWPG